MATKARERIKRDFRPDHLNGCENCGSKPSVPTSGLCGPCHFGTAAAVNGGWWDEGDDDFDGEFVEEHM